MNKKHLYTALPLVVLAGVLAGCSTAATEADDTANAATVSALGIDATQTAAQIMAANDTEPTEASDFEWDAADAVAIALSGSSATADGDGVEISGDTVTITAAGTYVLSGSLDGQLVVDTEDEGTVRLVLDDADIASSSSAAIFFASADEAMVVLADGSVNSLSDTDSYADDAEAGAALDSTTDLVITGEGALEVSGNGNDGIASSDGLTIDSGNITVDAVDDGLRGKDFLVVQGGDVTVTSGGDGLKSDNEDDETRGYIALSGGTVEVDAAGDGVQAETDIVVTGGGLSVTAGGGAGEAVSDDTSTKGIKSGVFTVFEGGSVTVDASDDAVHSDGALHIASGDVTVASGDDGFHAEGAAYIDGGTTVVTESYEGLEGMAITIVDGSVELIASDDGLNVSSADGSSTEAGPGAMGGPGGGAPAESSGSSDNHLSITGGTLVVDADGDGIDVNGTASIEGGTIVVTGPTDNANGALDVDGSFTITGGTLLAAGSSGMVVAPSTDSAQASVALAFDSAVAAGTVVTIVDGSGEAVGTFATSKATQSIVFSSEDVVAGETYTAHLGGTAGAAIAGGLAETGEYPSADVAATAVAGEAPAGGMGGGGGGGAGGGFGGGQPPTRP